MIDHRRTIVILWVALCGALAASFTHLATLFYRYEPPGTLGAVVAVLGAAAVDVGVLASMRAIGERAAVGRSTRNARVVVAGLVALSMAANAAHALALGNPATVWELWLAIGAAAALPLIVLGLAVLLDELRRPTLGATGADATAAAASVRVPVSAPAPARVVAQRPAQRPATGTAQARVLAALTTAPADASARELARLAGVGDGTVRRMAEAGAIHRNGAGWTQGQGPAAP